MAVATFEPQFSVHKEFYQLHHSTLELTRVAMLLTLTDENKANQFASRPLKHITLEGMLHYSK